MPEPCRVQRPRRKGTALPSDTIYVGRPTMWANPFAGRQWGHAKSVILHRRWLRGEIGAMTLERLGFSAAEVAALDRRRIWILTHLHSLAGKNLACWCPANGKWCHADIYLDLAPLHADYERYAA